MSVGTIRVCRPVDSSSFLRIVVVLIGRHSEEEVNVFGIDLLRNETSIYPDFSDYAGDAGLAQEIMQLIHDVRSPK